jgi:hypothetical protein
MASSSLSSLTVDALEAGSPSSGHCGAASPTRHGSIQIGGAVGCGPCRSLLGMLIHRKIGQRSSTHFRFDPMGSNSFSMWRARCTDVVGCSTPGPGPLLAGTPHGYKQKRERDVTMRPPLWATRDRSGSEKKNRRPQPRPPTRHRSRQTRRYDTEPTAAARPKIFTGSPAWPTGVPVDAAGFGFASLPCVARRRLAAAAAERTPCLPRRAWESAGKRAPERRAACLP